LSLRRASRDLEVQIWGEAVTFRAETQCKNPYGTPILENLLIELKMAWMESGHLPPWLEAIIDHFNSLQRTYCGLRASPRLLVSLCFIQFAVLIIGLLQQMRRVECAVAVPISGSVIIECDTCHDVYVSARSIFLHMLGGGVIGCGLLAVHWRHQYLLYIYGSCMLFFSLVIGLTAMLTALEEPMLELAASNVDGVDEICLQQAVDMLNGARDHATLAALGCLVDTAGAIFAIRSKELFNYEEIASKHAEIVRSTAL
jgi:hypothetical protein